MKRLLLQLLVGVCCLIVVACTHQVGPQRSVPSSESSPFKLADEPASALAVARRMSADELQMLGAMSNFVYRLKNALSEEELALLPPDKQAIIRDAVFDPTKEPVRAGPRVYTRDGQLLDAAAYLERHDAASLKDLPPSFKAYLRNELSEVQLQQLSVEKLNALGVLDDF
jgi:hypothetical protein